MIELKNLTKKFGDLYAVDHLNLKVETGEFLGLLDISDPSARATGYNNERREYRA